MAVSDLSARLGELGMDELANIGQDKGNAQDAAQAKL
jgi:hypothetical protein